MPKGGLEPPRVAPYAPQTYVSTNSTTSARGKLLIPTIGPGLLLEQPPERQSLLVKVSAKAPVD